jgi:hypothetical protein
VLFTNWYKHTFVDQFANEHAMMKGGGKKNEKNFGAIYKKAL